MAMNLVTLNYEQHEGEPKQWRLSGLCLGNVNLLVGKNATGKTRTLNVINGLAKLLSGTTKLRFITGNYEVVFDNDGQRLEYKLHYEQRKVISESFVLDDEPLLERGADGIGRIMAKKEKAWLDFQVPEDQLAAVARQDAIQHPFFAPLHQWAQSLYHYPFGTPLGQHMYAVPVKDLDIPFDPKDPAYVVAIFRRGLKDFPDQFKQSVMDDMEFVGFPLGDVDTQTPYSVMISGPFPSPPVGLCVQERDLAGPTDQTDMSQGMFRCLSVIIQITYAQMSSPPGSVLIDDIGEGLDYERSCQIIKLLTKKAEESKVQLIMATNDRFVMNTVPLKAWSVLQRSRGDFRVFNYKNSKEKFDEFKFTGMNNFDFFATDFLGEDGGKES
jgi:energy-coupling factor transporter ATP-binding protein EcfA2